VPHFLPIDAPPNAAESVTSPLFYPRQFKVIWLCEEITLLILVFADNYRVPWKDIENPLFLFEYGDKFAKFHFDFATKCPPKELFHYTSDAALLAILDSQCMLATERTYLNDCEEFEWGFNSFQEHLNSGSGQSYSEDFVNQVKTALNEKPNDTLRHFIVSLSANPNLLSQWIAYAENGKGVAIGLNGNTLRDRSGFGEHIVRDIDLANMPKDFCFCYHLLPVIYEQRAQKETVVEFLAAANTFWMQCEERNHPDVQTFFRPVFQHRVKELLISFKNPAFKEESEWRIVTTIHKDSKKILYRNGRFGITPYVKLNLSPRSILPNRKLDLTSLRVGPDSVANRNRRGLEMLLASKNIDIDLTFSGNGYRS